MNRTRRRFVLWIALAASLAAAAISWGALARTETHALATVQHWLVRGAVDVGAFSARAAGELLASRGAPDPAPPCKPRPDCRRATALEWVRVSFGRFW